MRQNSRNLSFVVGLVCLLVGGCYTESVASGVTTIAYAWWMVPLTIVGCVVLSVLGWLLRHQEGRAWWFAMFMLLAGPVVLVCGLPKLFTDKVTVDSEQLSIRSGYWFSPTTLNVKFADTHRFLLVTEISRGRRGRENKSHYLVWVGNNGQEIERALIDNLLEPALGKVIEQANAHQIAVDDHRK